MESPRQIKDILLFKIPFEEAGEISPESLRRTRAKAEIYHGVDSDSLDHFLKEAQEVLCEIQDGLREEIAERTHLFIDQVNTHISYPLTEVEEEAVSQMVRYQLAHCPDDQELGERLYRLAENMGQFFAARENDDNGIE